MITQSNKATLIQRWMNRAGELRKRAKRANNCDCESMLAEAFQLEQCANELSLWYESCIICGQIFTRHCGCEKT